MARGGKAGATAGGGRAVRRFSAVTLLIALCAAAGGPARGAAPLLQEVAWRPVGSGVEVEIRIAGAPADYRAFVLQDPPRIVIDLPGAASRFAGEQKLPVEAGAVRRIRHMGHPDKVRVVLDTETPALAGYAVAPSASGLRVAVPGVPGAQPAAAGAKPPAAEVERPAWIAHPAAAEALARTAEALAAEEEGAFEIKRFEVGGNTVISPAVLEHALKPFTGRGKRAEEVERARDALERLYHDRGYPTVLVNVPEQSVAGGVVRLEVVESRIGRVRVTGNEYFTMEKIQRALPSLRPGEILYLPRVQEDLAALNRNPDIKVAPVLAPGMEPGTVDVELKVKDKLPLHASMELNNRNTHDTTALRLNTQVHYDNLWQREHSVSIQLQTSPLDLAEVFAVAGSYVLPAPWGRDNVLALYGLYTDSSSAFGNGFETVGKGWIAGFRNVFPLPPVGDYAHNLSAGFDYKSFDDVLDLESDEATRTRIAYMPLSFAYSASLRDGSGTTQFSTGINLSFRGLVAQQDEFQDKRFEARGNYLYLTAGLERTQSLPYGFGLFGKLDGQVSDQPLIANEQFLAGGLKSVRGYKESETSGDAGAHATIELLGPDLLGFTPVRERAGLNPYLFYDCAWLRLLDPLPGQERSVDLQGAGLGLRGFATQHLAFELAWGMALAKTDRTDRGDSNFYFVLRGQF